MSVGKPTSSTLVSLTGLFKERDERIAQNSEGQTKAAEERLGEQTNVESSENEFVASRVKVKSYLSNTM